MPDSTTAGMRRQTGLRTVSVTLALLAAAATAQQEPQDVDFAPASAIVAELHRVLIDIMKNADGLGYDGRYQQVSPIVEKHFDTPLIVKVILSRHWNSLNDVQKAEFIQLFQRLSVATYASRFDSYDGQGFIETGREQLNAGRILIRTELTRSNEPPVKLDYLMHRTEQGEWRIISVIANGVNDLSLKRAEYAAVIKERGFDGLIDDIRGKIRSMETGTGA
jgi:phospholipid transport system substrate-binding protein